MKSKILDAYGHLTWVVGDADEEWLAAFDARLIGQEIEYHVVVNDIVVEHGRVPASRAGVSSILDLPEMYARAGADSGFGLMEWETTAGEWGAHLRSLLRDREPKPRVMRGAAAEKLYRFPEGTMSAPQWVDRYAEYVKEVREAPAFDKRTYNSEDRDAQDAYLARKAKKAYYACKSDGTCVQIPKAVYDWYAESKGMKPGLGRT